MTYGYLHISNVSWSQQPSGAPRRGTWGSAGSAILLGSVLTLRYQGFGAVAGNPRR